MVNQGNNSLLDLPDGKWLKHHCAWYEKFSVNTTKTFYLREENVLSLIKALTTFRPARFILNYNEKFSKHCKSTPV
jgi:hypothetical protein